ncbi:MAG TPA: TolC family protein [Gemmatimonadaceae bacterium]|nr:TolC family protein [Gemmatimonadaceae bacterium]
MIKTSWIAAAACCASLLAPSQAVLRAQGPTPAAPTAGDTIRLSLPDALARALDASDEVRLARAQIELAEAQVGVARASALPQLRLNTTYSHAYENARAQAVGSVFNQPNTYNANLNLSQSVFQGGRIFAGMRAASAVRQATRFDAQETRASVALGVQRAYLGALLAGRVADIQAGNLAIATQRLTQAEQFFTAGRVARYDVLRARVERANLEPALIEARGAREMAVLELKRLLNLPVESPLALTTALDADAASAAVAQIEAASSAAVVASNRAAVRAAELDLQARREGIRIARADYLPTLAISFANGYQAFPPPGMGFPSRFGEAAEQFCNPPAAGRVCQNGGWFSDRALNLTLSWPVFDGFRAKSNVDLAQAQMQLAQAQLQQERERVAIEAAQARTELARARATFEARRQTALEAQEAFELASLRYGRGLSTQLEVSDAQLALLTAQVGEARAISDLYLAAAELARSLGRPIPLPGGATIDVSEGAPRPSTNVISRGR